MTSRGATRPWSDSNPNGLSRQPIPRVGQPSPRVNLAWREQAACLDEDPELFFPVGETGPALRQIDEARQVRLRCPVREDCLAEALETGQEAGVWGGWSEGDRRKMKRSEARKRYKAQSAGVDA